MNKVIYSLKIYIFGRQFRISRDEENSLKKFCVFIITCYAEAWFNAPLAISAPQNDLNLLKKLSARYECQMWSAATLKLLRHMWYLNTELAAMSFFDANVSKEVKREMVQALNRDAVGLRFLLTSKDISELEISDFINNTTAFFF